MQLVSILAIFIVTFTLFLTGRLATTSGSFPLVHTQHTGLQTRLTLVMNFSPLPPPRRVPCACFCARSLVLPTKQHGLVRGALGEVGCALRACKSLSVARLVMSVCVCARACVCVCVFTCDFACACLRETARNETPQIVPMEQISSAA